MIYNNAEDIFTGRIEREIVDKLKKVGQLPIGEIARSYTNRHMARSLVEKLIHFKIARLKGQGILEYISVEERKE